MEKRSTLVKLCGHVQSLSPAAVPAESTRGINRCSTAEPDSAASETSSLIINLQSADCYHRNAEALLIDGSSLNLGENKDVLNLVLLFGLPPRR